MNLSRIFIERPIATSVLFVSIMFFGWLDVAVGGSVAHKTGGLIPRTFSY